MINMELLFKLHTNYLSVEHVCNTGSNIYWLLHVQEKDLLVDRCYYHIYIHVNVEGHFTTQTWPCVPHQ